MRVVGGNCTTSPKESESNKLYKSIRGVQRNILEVQGRSALFYCLGDSKDADVLIAGKPHAGRFFKRHYLSKFRLSLEIYIVGCGLSSGDAKWSDIKLANPKK